MMIKKRYIISGFAILVLVIVGSALYLNKDSNLENDDNIETGFTVPLGDIEYDSDKFLSSITDVNERYSKYMQASYTARYNGDLSKALGYAKVAYEIEGIDVNTKKLDMYDLYTASIDTNKKVADDVVAIVGQDTIDEIDAQVQKLNEAFNE